MERLRAFVRKNYFIWVVALLCSTMAVSAVWVVAALIDGAVSIFESLKSSPKEYGVDLKLMLSRKYFLEEQRLDGWKGKMFLNDGRRP